MKKKIYILVPLIGLIIFSAIYWNFSTGYEAKEAAKVAAEKQKKTDKLLAQAKANEQAIKEALAGQERRKAEKAAKEAKDKADHEARSAAVEAQNKADRDRQKYQRQVDRLEKDLKGEKEAIAKLEEEKKKFTDELAFLRIYVKQAEENAQSLSKILDKIAAADAARATAEAAAAAAAKKNNS